MFTNIPPIVVFKTGNLDILYENNIDKLNTICKEHDMEHIHQYKNYDPRQCIVFKYPHSNTLGTYITLLDQLKHIGCIVNNINRIKLRNDHIYFDVNT